MTQNGRSSNNGTMSEVDLIQTTDEEGNIHVFEKIAEFELEGQEYALLLYQGGEEEEEEAKDEGYDEEVVVMRVSYEDGVEVYEAIEDEAEFERVLNYIETMEDDDIEIDISEVSESDEEQ